MELNTALLSTIMRFYAKTLSFPFDELTHEFQYLFREAEKWAVIEEDEAMASRILDILNYYQGEDMHMLQGEYSRLFSHEEGVRPAVPLFFSDYMGDSLRDHLLDLINESGIPYDLDQDADSLINVLEYFSLVIEEGDDEAIIDFFLRFLDPVLGVFCTYLYQGSNINFYKEVARGLSELPYYFRPQLSE